MDDRGGGPAGVRVCAEDGGGPAGVVDGLEVRLKVPGLLPLPKRLRESGVEGGLEEKGTTKAPDMLEKQVRERSTSKCLTLHNDSTMIVGAHFKSCNSTINPHIYSVCVVNFPSAKRATATKGGIGSAMAPPMFTCLYSQSFL